MRSTKTISAGYTKLSTIQTKLILVLTAINTQVTLVEKDMTAIEYNCPFSRMIRSEAGVDNIRGFSIDESSWTREDTFIESTSIICEQPAATPRKANVTCGAIGVTS